MKAEKALWWLAQGCAVLLLFAWFNPKTVHVSVVYRSQAIQGWGWQNVAAWAGVFVLAALALGRANRERVSVAVLCPLVAAAAFTASAAETARTWIDLTWEAAHPDPYWTLRPATGMDHTVAVALVGAAFSLLLLGAWTHPANQP